MSSARREFKEFLRFLPGWVELWQEVTSRSPRQQHEDDLRASGNVVAGRINESLAWGAVRPSMTWRSGKVVVRFAGRRLGSRGTFRMSRHAVGAGGERILGLSLCSGCGTPYLPTRRPASSRRHDCSQCGKRAAQRDASRAYRSRRHALMNADR